MSQRMSNERRDRSEEGPKCRFCVDYQKLNELTEKYPAHRHLSGHARRGAMVPYLRSTLWVSSGYLDPRNSNKTAFICHRGTFRFRKMPLCLTVPDRFPVLNGYRDDRPQLRDLSHVSG